MGHDRHAPARLGEWSPLASRCMATGGGGANRWAAAFAAGSFLVLAVCALATPYRLREPDPYAYRAAMRAMAEGNLTLDAEQYRRLDTELLLEDDGWDRPNFSLAAVPFIEGCGPGPFAGPPGFGPPGFGPRGSGPLRPQPGIPDGCCPRRQGSFSGPLFGEAPPTGITQWVYLPDGKCASEKNPGYPALAFLFDAAGAVRLAPLFYGAIGCFGLWLGARRWLGPWGGALAVGLFCSPPAVLLMAHRAYMPSFTDTALLAGGTGLVMWAVLAADRSWDRRAVVGAAGFLLLALATTARYSNLLPAAVVAAWALLASVRARWGLDARSWLVWASGAVVPAIALALYNQLVFGELVATGYENSAGGNPRWELSSLPRNLGVMPGRLLAAMPIWPVALAALIALGVGVLRHRRSGAPAVAGAPPGAGGSGAPGVDADAWVFPLLGLWWSSIWGLYLMFPWTYEAVPAGGHFIISARFYLPAMGAMALLVAWLLAKLPPVSGAVIVAGLFAIGAISYVDAVNRDWLFGSQAFSLPGETQPLRVAIDTASSFE